MARRVGRSRGDAIGAAQLPLFGAEQAAEAATAITVPTPSSELRHANAWFGVHLASLDYSPNTVQSYTTSVELLARFLGEGNALRHVGPLQLQRYLEWLGERDPKPARAPAKTLALRVTGLRAFFQALTDAGVLPANPATDLWAPTAEPLLPDVLSPGEERWVRELAWAVYQRSRRRDARPLLLLMLTLDLGLRRGELETLQLSQVITTQPEVKVRIHYKERRHRYKNRTVQAPPHFRQVYRDYLQQYPPAGNKVFNASRRTLHRVVERLGQRTGANVRVTPMAMRWTCALHWYETRQPDEARQLLGLSPIGWQDAERALQGLHQRRSGSDVLASGAASEVRRASADCPDCADVVRGCMPGPS